MSKKSFTILAVVTIFVVWVLGFVAFKHVTDTIITSVTESSNAEQTVNEVTTEDNAISIKIISPEMSHREVTDIYLCPYCGYGLNIHNSSGQTSVAQFVCNFCGYESPEIHVGLPNAETECIEILKESFLTGNWTEEDIIGERNFDEWKR